MRMARLLQANIGLHEPSDDKFDTRLVDGQLLHIFSERVVLITE